VSHDHCDCVEGLERRFETLMKSHFAQSEARVVAEARLRRIEEAARAVFMNPLDIDAMLELGKALSTEEVIAEDISP
jgi:hypothetical protein